MYECQVITCVCGVWCGGRVRRGKREAHGGGAVCLCAPFIAYRT